MKTMDRYEARQVDLRVRLAMRILEFEQTRVPEVADIAKRVGVSPYHFARLFGEQVGESCAAYSRRIRLDNANNQMMHDPVPMGLVAETFGYRSQAAFTRAYVRQFGMPPTRYLAEVLGHSQAGYAESHLPPADAVAPDRPPLLDGKVRLVKQGDAPALARRFYGHDLADHWRRFLAELPDGLTAGARFAGMGYDNARVTPERHWRYDCAIVFDRPGGGLPTVAGDTGLDPVELPGGLHATCDVEGGFEDVWRATIGLFTEWLPAHRAYRPQGDPVVHWLHAEPVSPAFPATATIRVAPRASVPAYNMRPLTRHGRSAGDRTDVAED